MSDKRRSVAAEDGLLLLQSQALAEEEEAKTKGEMLARFLKDKLAKEERSSTLNLHKLRTQWRTVLREVKDKELRQDIEILSQTFARVMDCKDSVIESLATDLEEAEEQHAQALRSHLYNIDRLLQLQHCRLTCLEEGYGAQLEALKMELEAERYGSWGTPTLLPASLAQAMRDYVGLERFWQRFNKVKLEEQALERERATLSQRNRHLRELLRQYLAGISVSQEVLGEPNALLTVERKSCVPTDLPRAEGGRAQGHQGTKHPDSLLEGDACPDPIHGSAGTS
ncbi:dynein regulatory complex subunit 2 [Harpia harpyja]|uniref:dynein regulatory complex subunit 2 n=1 Tax=Harpia harpyja TaxID=202280 RepID=UPI0022B117EF|nr:dynein regulatory complex subunit 2 [Harpia harpyja]